MTGTSNDTNLQVTHRKRMLHSLACIAHSSKELAHASIVHHAEYPCESRRGSDGYLRHLMGSLESTYAREAKRVEAERRDAGDTMGAPRRAAKGFHGQTSQNQSTARHA